MSMLKTGVGSNRLSQFASFIGLLGLILLSSTSRNSVEIVDAAAENTSSAPAVMLPVGQKVFKVNVDAEGIYELSAADLIAKGMSSSLDPADIQLMQYGEAVAWELVSDPTGNPNLFDKNDKIRFYGWPFGHDNHNGNENESRAEKLYVNDNVFWVIPGRAADNIATSSGAPASTPVITSVMDEQRFEYDDKFSGMQMTDSLWALEGAEPDHYFWIPIARGADSASATNSLSIDLDHPSATANLATISALAGARLANTPGEASMVLPDNGSVSYEFGNGDIFTLTQTIQNNALSNGSNTIVFNHTRLDVGDSAGSYYVNYVDVTYQKDLKGSDNQLAFSSSGNGNQTFEISNFTASSAADFVVWNVTDRKAPQKLTATSVGGSNYRFSEAVASSADFAVASKTGIMQLPSSAISAYTPPSLDPAAGYADWLAIAHGDFIDVSGTTNDIAGLATHRANYSQLVTQVAAIEDVANQYGYGFKSSIAVKRYIQHAYSEWTQPVRYILLGGDGHYNPRHLDCTQCFITGANFQTPLDSLIPIYHSYTDKDQGLIPSDFRYTLLTGDDLIPEVAIGRLSVENTNQLQDAVSKIVLYENNLLAKPTWHKDMLFTHDWPLGVPDNIFRVESEEAEKEAETYGFNVSVAGLHVDPGSSSDPAATSLRQTISNSAGNGVSLITWRGHGSVTNWSGGDIMSVNKVLNNQLLPNIDKPFISITYNCLDGNFAYPALDGLGESLQRLGEKSNGNVLFRNTGSAAHFAATGLGTVDDHEIIADALFEAIFKKGLTRFGDAINDAKVESIPTVFDSELYSYNLLGDPAMTMYAADLGNVAASILPVELKPDDLATITFEIPNYSSFTASAETTFKFTLPKDLDYKTTFIDYSGPDSDQFNNLNNPALEPVTITTETDSSDSTILTVVFNQPTENQNIRTGGIPADGGVTIRVFVQAKSTISQAFGLAPYTLHSSGDSTQNNSVAIDFGGGRSIYLPLVQQK
ncbi:MAG: C25 family cysteine peptidase [Anaerolineae bacterium]